MYIFVRYKLHTIVHRRRNRGGQQGPGPQSFCRGGGQNSMGAQWPSGRVLDSRPRCPGLEPHRRHCVVSLSKNINPSLVLVQPRKTRFYITERLLMGHKESNQTCMHTHVLNIHTLMHACMHKCVCMHSLCKHTFYKLI